MDRRDFLAAAVPLTIAPLAMPSKPAGRMSRVFINDPARSSGFNEVAIITDDKDLVNKLVWPVSATTNEAYDTVQKFVAEKNISYLLNNGPKPGTSYYWEENYSDKFRNELRIFYPEVGPRNLSNALYIIENEFKEV